MRLPSATLSYMASTGSLRCEGFVALGTAVLGASDRRQRTVMRTRFDTLLRPRSAQLFRQPKKLNLVGVARQARRFWNDNQMDQKRARA